MWNFILKHLAQAQGFLDPTVVFSRLQRFSQPSEVWVPTELLRSGAVLQGRGLINSQAIQNNLDWIWPYWVEQQFSPLHDSFIPRAFNLTHINLTCRNWTAVGLPDITDLPIVDPRGLVTPFFDGWSLDGWLITDNESLIPSRACDVQQKIVFENNLIVHTVSKIGPHFLKSEVRVEIENDVPVCKIAYHGLSSGKGRMVIALRPYNCEGISFIGDIGRLTNEPGWQVNHRDHAYLNQEPEEYYFSNYASGDAYTQFSKSRMPHENQESIHCQIGMANSAAVFALEPNQLKEVTVSVPLSKTKATAVTSWPAVLRQSCRLAVPDNKFQFLYDMALRTMVLHSPGTHVYAGPFTYKRFWFRDAAFILNAMITAGLLKNVEAVIDGFSKRQTPLGYFVSQEGEWDSNGQALWIMDRFLVMTGRPIKKEWIDVVNKAAQWIERKLLADDNESVHSGLLPPGFSAEHFGPSDYYYWDDFWAVAGLRAAAHMVEGHNPRIAHRFHKRATDLLFAINRSLSKVQNRLDRLAIPSSPYRRLDSGAVGSLTCSYPLQLYAPHDPRVMGTVDFLNSKYLLHQAFYHEISHSGINVYLSLNLAQTMLRADDQSFFEIVKGVADLASPTGQWPEAIHPWTKGGCMGDGQHVWAAAEWVLMLRNMFVREEEEDNRLILCSGIPHEWLDNGEPLFLGPVITVFGTVSIRIQMKAEHIHVSWEARWARTPPVIEIRLPGYKSHCVTGETGESVFSKERGPNASVPRRLFKALRVDNLSSGRSML